MNLFSLNSDDNKKMMVDINSFDTTYHTRSKDGQIHHGMTVNEISEVVSDHLMSVIKDQFETAKKNFQTDSH